MPLPTGPPTETAIPASLPNRLTIPKADIGECPSATEVYHLVGNRIKCFYDDGDDAALRSLHAIDSTWHSRLKEEFCKLSKNVFKNPGGGQCLEYDTTKALAKEYCSVGHNIAMDALCTQTNLGNFYPDVAAAYCRGAGKTKTFCSCYNVKTKVCDTDSGAAGCENKRTYYDKLVEATPQEFKYVWAGKEACFGACSTGEKMYLPDGYSLGCDAPVQICSQNFSLDNISDSSIEAQCNLTANTGTPPSAGGGGGSPPSGSPSNGSPPSGTPPSGTPPSGSPPSGGINDYIPRSIEELKTDSKKQMAVGGVGGLFLICCLLLLVVVMASSGGKGGDSSSFRR